MLDHRRRFCTRLLITSTCLVTFQAYLVAPLAPGLSSDLRTSSFALSFSIPCFAISFALSSFFSSLFIEHINKKKYLTGILVCITLSLLCITASDNVGFFLFMRVLTGFLCGCLVQLSIFITYHIFHNAEREQAFDWLILAQATGMTFGPTAGICLYVYLGWRWQFIALAAWSFLATLSSFNKKYEFTIPYYKPLAWNHTIKKCRNIFKNANAKKMYVFVYLTGVFHSGLFVWISAYLINRCHFGNEEIGFALLLFSLPGLLMAIPIAKTIQKNGFNRMVLQGLLVVASGIFILVTNTVLWLVIFAIAILSIGYVMTQPFYIGVINSVYKQKTSGLSHGIGFGLLFIGYGTGPILFNFLNSYGILEPTMMIILLEILLAWLSVTSNLKAPDLFIQKATEGGNITV